MLLHSNTDPAAPGTTPDPEPEEGLGLLLPNLYVYQYQEGETPYTVLQRLAELGDEENKKAAKQP